MIATHDEIVANMKESYRIAKSIDGAGSILSKIENTGTKSILENFFYLGFIYGAEWSAKKIQDELPNDLLEEMIEALKDARDR